MPRTINPIRKMKVKKALREGKSARQALKEAGYSPGTIRVSTGNTIVKTSIDEIQKELKETDITILYVLKNLLQDRSLAITKKDYSTVVRVDELLGRYLTMFKDKQYFEDTTDKKDVENSIDKLLQGRG